jgi:hypothetical protein
MKKLVATLVVALLFGAYPAWAGKYDGEWRGSGVFDCGENTTFDVQFIVDDGSVDGTLNENTLQGHVVGHRLKARSPVVGGWLVEVQGSLLSGNMYFRVHGASGCGYFRVQRIGDAPKRITEKDPDQAVETNSGETILTPTDAEAPTIHLPDTLVSASHEIELVGKVTDQSAIESLTIDGEKVLFGADGSFSHSVYIPRRGVEIQVVALDERGNRAEKTISITRAAAEEALFSFAKLDPRVVRAAKNHKAIALVIGIAEYSDAPEAPYADLDAEYFADYVQLALGVPA